MSADLVGRIESAVERLQSELVERLQELVRIPSVTGEEHDVQQAVARQMADLGLEVDQWEPDVDQLAEFAEDVGAFESLAGRPNVVGRLRGMGSGRSLILNAHIDTVEPGAVVQLNDRFVVVAVPWALGTSNGSSNVVSSLAVALFFPYLAIYGPVISLANAALVMVWVRFEGRRSPPTTN